VQWEDGGALRRRNHRKNGEPENYLKALEVTGALGEACLLAERLDAISSPLALKKACSTYPEGEKGMFWNRLRGRSVLILPCLL
jgi:hypothetical protein